MATTSPVTIQETTGTAAGHQLPGPEHDQTGLYAVYSHRGHLSAYYQGHTVALYDGATFIAYSLLPDILAVEGGPRETAEAWNSRLRATVEQLLPWHPCAPTIRDLAEAYHRLDSYINVGGDRGLEAFMGWEYGEIPGGYSGTEYRIEARRVLDATIAELKGRIAELEAQVRPMLPADLADVLEAPEGGTGVELGTFSGSGYGLDRERVHNALRRVALGKDARVRVQLRQWGAAAQASDAERDQLVRAARKAGVSKMHIHQDSGLSRATIDRILADEN